MQLEKTKPILKLLTQPRTITVHQRKELQSKASQKPVNAQNRDIQTLKVFSLFSRRP